MKIRSMVLCGVLATVVFLIVHSLGYEVWAILAMVVAYFVFAGLVRHGRQEQ